MLLADSLKIIKKDLMLIILLGIHTETADELEPPAAETFIQVLHEHERLILDHLVVHLAVDCVILGDLPTLSTLATLHSQLAFPILSPIRALIRLELLSN